LELPRRGKGDQYTPPGRYRELESQVRHRARGADIPILFVYAFDDRTRLGPFLFCDKKLIPAAPRAIGSALHAAGLTNVRLVLQQWSPNVRPSEATWDGRRPEVLMVSAMQIHSAAAYDLIRDAWTLGPERPLILAGGSKAVFEPWDYFGLSADGSVGADVVVTGEEFVLLELLDRVLEHKARGETMRRAFERVRGAGLLDDVPGLVFRPDPPEGPPPYLVNTGIQRLVRDLDELPLPLEAMGLFEPPHRRPTLSARPVPRDQIRRWGQILSIVTTHGCKFRCPYCPIPGYNQYTFRSRSAQRLVEEMTGLAGLAGITNFFGTDDNFFNDRETTERVFAAMARGSVRGRPFREAIWFATEATEIDVFKNRDLLPLARDAGLRSLWFGIEDMTAGLVKKGQSPEKTKAVFKLLLEQGIAPMPMMMHHDGQPLWTRRSLYGLLNQVEFLWRAGALTCQVTLLTPSVGSKGYEQAFREGVVLKSAGGRPVEEYQYDGNHCVAAADPHPWRRQLNIFAAYMAFYNPINLLRAVIRFDPLWAERIMVQWYGMVGTAKSMYRLRGWFRRLVSGPIERFQELGPPKFRMVAPQGVEPELVHYGQLSCR